MTEPVCQRAGEVSALKPRKKANANAAGRINRTLLLVMLQISFWILFALWARALIWVKPATRGP